MDENDYTIDVGLCIRGKDLDPDDVTRALGITPNHSYRKGEMRLSRKTNRAGAAKTGMWRLKAESDSSLVSDHVAQLLSSHEIDGDVINGLPGVDEAFIDIFVMVPENNRGGGDCAFDFSAELVAAVARTGLPVRVTVRVVKR